MLNRRQVIASAAISPAFSNPALLGQHSDANYHDEGYLLRTLRTDQLDYTGPRNDPTNNNRLNDQGIWVYLRSGEEFNHPVGQAQFAMGCMSYFRHTGNKTGIEFSLKQADALIDESVVENGARYFPYLFSWPAVPSSDRTWQPPWYSGMAQGQALQLFVRLAMVDDVERWMTAAEEVFNSFLPVDNFSLPWTPDTDEDGNLWFEEYPANEKGGQIDSRAFNGHVFAILGVYEYWLATNDERAQHLVSAAATTIKRTLAEFRREGNISYYSLGHKTILKSYHFVHVRQLRTLYALTGDPDFASYLDYYIDDFELQYVSATVSVPAGTHLLLKQTFNEDLEEERIVRFTADTEFSVSQRTSITDRAGVWFLISQGKYEGFYIQEVPGEVQAQAELSGTKQEYDPPRAAILDPSTYSLYEHFNEKPIAPMMDMTLHETTEVTIHSRQIIDAEWWFNVEIPDFGWRWIKRTPTITFV